MIYVQVARWQKGCSVNGVSRLLQLGIIQFQVNIVSLDSTCIKVHPDSMGALKKGSSVRRKNTGRMEYQTSYGATSDRDGVNFSLSVGNCGDASEGHALLRQLDPIYHFVYLLMDRAYEGDEARALAMELGYIPVVPPKSNRKNPWDYDKRLYKQRNQVEGRNFFAASKGFVVFLPVTINLMSSF